MEYALKIKDKTGLNPEIIKALNWIDVPDTFLLKDLITENSINDLYLFLKGVQSKFSDLMQLLDQNGISYNLKELIEAKCLIVTISTYGGNMHSGFAIYDLLVDSPFKIVTVGLGKVMSAGFLIFLAGDVRRSNENTRFMIHEVSTVTYGTLSAIEEDLNEAKILNDIAKRIIVSKTAITMEQLNTYATQKKDWYMSKKEAMELKVLTEL